MNNDNSTRADFAAELRDTTIGIKYSCTQFSRSKKLQASHHDTAAESLDVAKKRQLKTAKALYPSNQQYIDGIHAVASQAYQTWKTYTRTCPGEKGTRLLKKHLLEDFQADMQAHQDDLQAACLEADAHRDEILAECEAALGDKLFDAADYPTTFVGSIEFEWTTRTFAVDESLLELAPETYAREQARVAAQFDLALEVFESETREQLSQMLDAVLAKLNPENGKKVRYTEAGVNNLREFFADFKRLNIRSDEKLATLIQDCEAALGDTTMAEVKNRRSVAKDLKEKFTGLKGELNQLIESAPKRAVNLSDLDD